MTSGDRGLPGGKLPARLNRAAVSDDTSRAADLRRRIDQLSGATGKLRLLLGDDRRVPGVADALAGLEQELRSALLACNGGMLSTARGYVQRAEAAFRGLEGHALATRALTAVREAIDGAVREAEIAGYQSLPTLCGLYRAVDIVGRQCLARGARMRALAVARTVRGELTLLFDSAGTTARMCRVCSSAFARLGEDAARLDALRESGRRELANRLACDIAARRVRATQSDGLVYRSAGTPDHQDLMLRCQRIDERVRECVEAIRSVRGTLDVEGTDDKR